MPGGDGTGPMGMGPMTGGGRGFCAGYPTPGYANPQAGNGWGFGFRRGRGRGRGWGRRGFAYWPTMGYPYYGSPIAQEFTPKQESDMLREEARAMQREVDAINQRITELESSAKKTA